MLCSCITISSYGQTDDGVIYSPDTKTGSCCDNGCLCANSQAPIGVMTASIHEKHKWMVGYTYMNMQMQGSLSGTAKQSNDAVYKNYEMSPNNMTMQMHMAMVMYGVTDKLTLMGMVGYAFNDMTMSAYQHLSCCPPGSNIMQSSSSGLADTKVYALYSLMNKSDHQLIGSVGVNLPTGTIDATGITVLSNDGRLPYNMQLGTGSFGLLPALTYLGKLKSFPWGVAANADVKLNTNNNGYKYGNTYGVTAWMSHPILPFVSASLRAEGSQTGKITGQDKEIAKQLPIGYHLQGDPTADAANSGGQSVNVFAGLNIHFDNKALDKFRLRMEYGMPVYQNLNGTQMSQKGSIIAGIQYAF